MANYKRTKPHQTGVVTAYKVEKYEHVYLPLQAQGTYAIANASDQADIAIEDAVVSAGAGNPSFGEVGATGYTGLHIDAAGDDIRHLWPIPNNCDVKYDMQFRVWWSSASSTTTDGFTWKVLYNEHTADGEALTAPATALDTAIAEDTLIGANYLQASPWGILNGGTLTNNNILGLLVELDATDATVGSEATYAYLLEIRYVRRTL